MFIPHLPVLSIFYRIW